jgi:hypothetical protein
MRMKFERKHFEDPNICPFCGVDKRTDPCVKMGMPLAKFQPVEGALSKVCQTRYCHKCERQWVDEYVLAETIPDLIKGAK